jgi:hypothetical protein
MKVRAERRGRGDARIGWTLMLTRMWKQNVEARDERR